MRRAILQQRNVPNGVQLSSNLYKNINMAVNHDHLLNVLVNSEYWSWVDLRLLETLAMSSGILKAKVLVDKYKSAVFSKRLSDVLDNFCLPWQKATYINRVAMMIEKDPNEIVVGDLVRYRDTLKAVIMDINHGHCVLEHLDTGCVEIPRLEHLDYSMVSPQTSRNSIGE